MSPESSVELVYFNMRGRAEASRLLLTVVDASFEDHRVCDVAQWSKLKPRLPFGALPILKDGPSTLSQSHAILRYLAYRYELLQNSLIDQSIYDEAQFSLAEAQEDLWQFAWREDYLTDPEPYATGRLSFFLNSLQAHLAQHGGDCWIGNSISHIDCLAFAFLDELRAFFPTTLASFARLSEFHETFKNRPPVHAYIESGRRPAVFGMALNGPKIDPEAKVAPGEMFENPWTDPVPLS